MNTEGSCPHIDHLWCATRPTLATISSFMSRPFMLPMKANRRGRRGGTEDEITFCLFCVSVSIFLGLTDRPINLIYCVFPHPLTSSAGLLFNNELLRLGTVGVLVPILFLMQLLRWQHCIHAAVHVFFFLSLSLFFLFFLIREFPAELQVLQWGTWLRLCHYIYPSKTHHPLLVFLVKIKLLTW